MRLLGLGALILLIGSSARAQTVDGWTLTVKTTTDSGSSLTRHTITSRIRIAGNLSRTELSDDRLHGGPRPLELPIEIKDDSAKTRTVIFTSSRRATVMNTTAPIVLPGPHDSAAHFVSAPTMTMRDLGPGEPILGHPTHRYSFTESYVAQTTLFDQPCKRTVNSVELIWTATDLPREEKLRRYVFDARPPTGTPLGYVNDSLARIRLHRERLVNGFLLRSESSITRPGAHGTNTTTKITMEVSELAHGPVPRSLFAVPDGFTLTGRAVPAAIRTRAESAALRERRAKVNSQVSERMHAIMCDP